jgi:hypothetical protein
MINYRIHEELSTVVCSLFVFISVLFLKYEHFLNFSDLRHDDLREVSFQTQVFLKNV